jgi:hypothetical protein
MHLQFILCHELKVEPVEMGKPAVPAPDGEMPAADYDIMRTGHMTVPAFCITCEFPYIVTTYLREHPGFAHILDPGDKDPGRTAVVACYLRFVRHGFDDLVCQLLAVVTVGAVDQKNKPVAHVS